MIDLKSSCGGRLGMYVVRRMILQYNIVGRIASDTSMRITYHQANDLLISLLYPPTHSVSALFHIGLIYKLL